MSSSFNKITVVGYLGRDPEIRYTQQGNAVCNFSVATTEKRKDRDGEAQDVTTWFRISAWGRQAELANQFLARGSKVYVDGRLRMETYTDRDGNERVSLEVNANDVQFLDPRKDSAQSSQAGAEGGDGEASAPATARSNGKSSRSRRSPKEPVENDDVPF